MKITVLVENTARRPERTEAIGKELLKHPTKYYTCHCTGLAAYDVLKAAMGDAVDYAACGDVIEL